jgi:AcrR family transcriptional regulator
MRDRRLAFRRAGDNMPRVLKPSMTITSSQLSSGIANQPRGTAEAIRDAAVALFASRGYKATTMNDIGRSVGIRGSAIYNHVPSKQELLRDIMLSAMHELSDVVRVAIKSADDIPEQLRLGIRQHVLYHARGRLQFGVGNREIPSLEEPARTEIIDLRRRYVEMFENVIEAGLTEGTFRVQSARIAAYSILQSGMGVAVWYDPEGPMSDIEIADLYGEFALRTVGYRG